MPDPVFLDSEDAHAWLDQHRPERHDPDPWRTPVSIAPTPTPPGRPRSETSAERAMHATSRTAKR